MSKPTATACDLTRDALDNATKCACPDSNLAQCKGVTETPPSCAVWKLADYRDTYFKWQYNPADLLSHNASSVRKAKLEDLGADIVAQENILKSHYGDDAPVDELEYWKMQRCLRSSGPADGASDQYGKEYVNRPVLQAEAGYAPQPLFGGKTLEGKLPASATGLVPVMADRFVNADLALILILIILIAVLWGLIASVSKWRKGAYQRNLKAKVARVHKEQAHDKWGFLDPTVQEDPKDKWRLMIPQYEAQGYCMKEYRQKLGMPPGPDC